MIKEILSDFFLGKNREYTINPELELEGKISISRVKSNNQIKDLIDWKMIDQLHNATLNFSRNSQSYKKIYTSVLTASGSLSIIMKVSPLSLVIMVLIMLITILFWIMDASTYYYQENLREKIDIHINEIRKRHNINDIENNDALPNYRKNNQKNKRFRRSLFNISNGIYIMVFITCFAFLIKILFYK